MTSRDSERYRRLAAGVLAHHEEVCAPAGVSIGLIRRKNVFFFSHGSLHNDGGRAINQDSVFEIGSVTKTFTALLISLAISRNIIAPDAFIDNLLPASAQLNSALRNKIRVTDLASHQAGLPTLADDQYLASLLRLNARQPFAAVDTRYIQQVLSSTDCVTDYGSYHYSNFSYALLGLIVEQCTGLQYESALAAQLTGPLSMARTTLASPLAANQAGGFTRQGAVAERLIANKIAPAGGLCSTAADLLKYVTAQLNPGDTWLGKAIELSHQAFCVANGFEVGLGWNSISDGARHYFEKTGDTFGNSSLVRFDKQNKIGIVVLSNQQNSSLVAEIADELYCALL
ncbi:serine hydrolase domain-containing protein [Hymenobacter cheonanensis]|uniref:serine hydrolase domain-containing protein n=1 Tax=Hymenobacter sp. CA2-7 TaxID=3063993 RepID=UPI002714035E|nr:serine hydrolase domain-containing protein [Hymenobacter sp. CA2-7]MDO7888080.1 serine hydrolase domain-containing protein [Hymenobacter sp. CA2-7]